MRRFFMLVALLDRDDRDHAACSGVLASSTELRLVPAPVLVERDHVVPAPDFSGFLRDVRRGAFVVVDLTPADDARVDELLHDDADLRVGFVDAAVPAIVERLRERRLVTLNRRHFTVMRPAHTDTLELLPER